MSVNPPNGIHSPDREFHRDLPEGTLLHRIDGIRIRVVEMRGDWASVVRARKDGQCDWRQGWWSCSLPCDLWTVETKL